MKKNIFIIIFVFIIFSYISFGAYSDGLAFCLSCNSDCVTDATGNFTGTNTGCSSENGGINNTNACYFVSGESDRIDFSSLANDGFLTRNHTVFFYYRKLTTSSTSRIMIASRIGFGEYIDYSVIKDVNGNDLTLDVHDGVSNTRTTGDIALGVWHSFGAFIDYQGKIRKSYFNNASLGSATANTHSWQGFHNFTIGALYNAGWGSFFNGYIDEIMIWDRELSDSELQGLSGINRNITCLDILGGGGGGTTPSLTLSINFTDNQNITSNPFWFNFSGVSVNNSNTYNCTLLFNNTIKQSEINDLTNGVVWNISTSGLEELIFFNLSCFNENATDEINFYNIFFDVINPVIILESGINQSSNYDSITLEYQINFSDTNLYAIESNLTCASGLINYFFSENIGISLFMYNISNTTSSMGIGNCSGIAQAWDSHTNNELTDIPIKLNNSYVYKNVLFTCDNIRDIKYIMETDRIKYDITFNDKQLEQYCYYYGNFKPVRNSRYINHYVDFKNKVWIDDIDGNSIIEKDRVKIIYTNTQKIITESIGDLNYINISYSFTIIDTPSLNTQLLTDINNTLFNLNNISLEIGEGINMIGFVIFFCVLLIIGLLSKFKIMITISSFILFWWSVTLIDNFTEATTQGDSFTYLIPIILFVILGVVLFIMGVILQLYESFEDKKPFKLNNKKKKFYIDY